MPRRAFSDRPPWRHGNSHESRNCVAGTQAVSSFATRSSDHAFLVGREPRQLRCGQGCSTVAVVPLHQCQSPKPLSEKTTDLGSCENSVFFSLRCRPKVASPQCPPISGDAVQAPKLGSVRLSELIFLHVLDHFSNHQGQLFRGYQNVSYPCTSCEATQYDTPGKHTPQGPKCKASCLCIPLFPPGVPFFEQNRLNKEETKPET